MSINYKTTKGNKVSIDYSRDYYEWKDVREYVFGDTNECQVYFDLGRDYLNIDETLLSDNQISYILGNDEREESFSEYEKKEKNKFKKDMEEYLKTHYIIKFKVSDLGSSGMYLRTINDRDKDASGFIIRKSDKNDKGYDKDELKETLNYFRAYIKGTFVDVRIYSPVVYVNEKDPEDKIIKYNFEDGGEYFLSQEQALESVDTNTWGEILKDTETVDS